MILAILALLALIGGVIATALSGNIIIGAGMFLSLIACYGSWVFSWNK
jgi:hypothetical protein